MAIATGFQTVNRSIKMVKKVRIIREGRMVVTVMDSVSAMEQEKTSVNIEWSTLP